MKIIKYQLETEINYGTPEEPDIETLLSPVTVAYTEEAYAIAQDEAYQGQITVEDDGVPVPPPTAQEQLRADGDVLAAMPGAASCQCRIRRRPTMPAFGTMAVWISW